MAHNDYTVAEPASVKEPYAVYMKHDDYTEWQNQPVAEPGGSATPRFCHYAFFVCEKRF